MWESLYFDKKDDILLNLVNNIASKKHITADDSKLFATSLHPHGIKSLTISREMRMAHAVVELLDSLDAGTSKDRLDALQVLYDEVLNSAQTTLRRNTARVLIQVMKDLIRAHGCRDIQRQLAHDFRRAAQGKPRVVRELLNRYHLVEMPEDWSQFAFDHHVHDAHTKGRKNPTHLIMDSWIKGIRYLTVVYYNYVEVEAVREVLYAAKIMGMQVRIGIEFSTPFHGRYVDFIWVPRGFSDVEHFLNFLEEAPVQHLFRLGREASAWRQRYVFTILHAWNEKHRHEAIKTLGLAPQALLPITDEAFKHTVGIGQASIEHLSHHIYEQLLPHIETQRQVLQQNAHNSTEKTQEQLTATLATIRALCPTYITKTWLSPEKNQEIPSPHVPQMDGDTPELLRLQPLALLDWLSNLCTVFRVTLCPTHLQSEDVLELLWNCQGLITHIELFNLKDWKEGSLCHVESITALQHALNTGSAPRLKRIILDMLQNSETLLATQRTEITKQTPTIDKEDAIARLEKRCTLLRTILRNIPMLQSFYRRVPLRVHMGTNATSHHIAGGFVFKETLPAQGQQSLMRHKDQDDIPFYMPVDKQIKFVRNKLIPQNSFITRCIRALPGLENYGYTHKKEWIPQSSTAQYTENSNIIPLADFARTSLPCPSDIPREQKVLKDQKIPKDQNKHKKSCPSLCYLNTKLVNVLKVLLGFFPAALAFYYTQSWWVLAWFGACIWFAITGIRNILQAVLAGDALHRSNLLRWNDHVSWSRLCDSLMYTGFSVPIIELGVRFLLLDKILNYTVTNDPIIVYTVMSLINGLYIAWHNILRGLPREAVVGNMLRSVLAVPLAILLNESIEDILTFVGVLNAFAFVETGAAIISKVASDTVAAIIEGYADKKNNIRMRFWDYETKVKQIFATYAHLELSFPEENVFAMLTQPQVLLQRLREEHMHLYTELIINALDLMYFWLYRPRAQDVCKKYIARMSAEERAIFGYSQLVLLRERAVSQLFVDGLVGKRFNRALSIYLNSNNAYVRKTIRLCNLEKSE